ncbi:HlyD family type I secretion periplasmic adaptor subunit [Ferrovibrio sp.]|uniref:HlyD family type I secretion periplasmic adaptor subunit n=1 Tax=Ferrovibrio sp. TaxID=1917215 RepID=UPI0025BC53FE|nr:HlyD family type I secretion periplasmic adaptor subunit [Ferrovibrio sp.]MBX3454258.1 HlyD family type I secretion periplasmic adaptor subunit [Ferrovibrio sp.]
MPFDSLRRIAGVTAAALAHERSLPARTARGRDETAFLPAALELLETPPSPTARLLFWSLAALIAVAIGWSFIGQLDVVAVAEGRLVPAGKVKLVQPLEAGIVRAIHIQDGQSVRAGDLLIELDTAAVNADQRRLESDLVTSEAEASRLRAALHPDAPLAHFQPSSIIPEALRTGSRALLLSQVEEYNARQASLTDEMARRRAERRTLETSIERAEKALPLLRQRVDARRELAEKGFGSRLLLLELQQQQVEQEHELVSLRHKREESNASIAALEKQVRQYQSEYRKNVLTQLTEVDRKIASLTEELLKVSTREGQQRLSAPTAGVVQQLAINTIGGVVTSAQPLMVIVPADMPIFAEVKLLNRDIGFVQPGQPVEVKLEAFPFTKYGTVAGRVDTVSSDAIQDETRGLVYIARIALDQEYVEVAGREVKLSPGMALTAEIKTDRRRVIDYLLSPIARHRDESLRER